MNVKIMVACHKQAKVFSNETYMPIHVGKALHRDTNWGFVSDDTGDNISVKNASYCELTAQYWAWKNLTDVDIIGLCHYRRYFEGLDSEEKITKCLKGYDIILPSPILWHCNLENKLTRELTAEDVAIFYHVLNKLYPEYEKTMIEYLYGFHFVGCNMFICRKELFNSYADFQFRILSECEKYIKLSGYTRLKRIFGYLGEYLLPVYCYQNKIKIKYVDIVPFMGDKALNPFILKKKLQYLINIFFPTVKKPKSLMDIVDSTVSLSLKTDGITITPHF